MNAIKHVALLILFPLSAIAELEVIALPMNPFIHAEVTNNIFITVTNVGKETELIPRGLLDADGLIIPTWGKTIRYDCYRYDQNIPQFITGGSSMEFRSMFMDGISVSNGVTNAISDCVYSPNQKLPPDQSVTYKLDFHLYEDLPPLTNELFDICIITAKFSDFEIIVPPITFYSDKNNSSSKLIETQD